MKLHNRVPRQINRSILACALASCMAMATPQVMAQTANANLRGMVLTDSTPSAGAEVTATNVATGAVRRTRTGADGSYSLVGLPPGTYTVRSGSSAQTVTLAVASTSTLNLTAAGTAESPGQEATDLASVVVSAPMLKDVKTSEVGTTVSLRQIEQLPQATRNFLEFADTVPGMAFEINAQGHTSLRGGATNSSSGNLYIDGVGQKSYVKSGGIAGQSGTQGNPFPQLAIGEYKVITSNYKAEYGQISGAAVTAVTRSGTNDFEGEAFYRFTNEDLRDKRADEEAPGEEKSDSQTKEYGQCRATFGGARVAGGQLRPVPAQRRAEHVRPGQPAVQRRPVLRQDRLGYHRQRPPGTERTGARRDPGRFDRRRSRGRPRSQFHQQGRTRNAAVATLR
jgi:hypothetical protein